VIGLAPLLRLDELAHRAFLGDRELVRATTALADVGIIETGFFTEESRLRGQYLHDAIALYHQDELAEESLDPVLVPFWEGYRAFLAESEFQPHSVEQPVYDDIAGYAGRYDLFGQFPKLPPTAYDLIDVKTGRAASWVKLQTIGYRRRVLVGGAPVVRCRRWALELPGDGRYRLLALNLQNPIATHQIDRQADQRHEAVFLAAVTVANWKRGLIR
jgi:hypothetical protein